MSLLIITLITFIGIMLVIYCIVETIVQSGGLRIMNMRESSLPNTFSQVNILKFYRERDQHGYMSNFSAHPFIDSIGQSWPTTEHYYQAKKFNSMEIQELIRNAKSPKSAKDLGQVKGYSFKPEWEDIKVDVMLQALRYKFKQHKDLADQLLATGMSYIVEDSPWDYVWGCGPDFSGSNLLGLCLMVVRAELHNERRVN